MAQFTLFVVLAALLATAYGVPKISVSDVALTLESGMSRTIEFSLSQPINCIPNPNRRCGVVLLITNTNTRDVFIDTCQITWWKGEWWQPRYLTVMVKPEYINRGEQTIHLITEAPITDSPFYNLTDANPADIVLQTRSEPSKVCTGVGDPHYRTFDGKYWHMYEAGQIVFYGSTEDNFEVQTKVYRYPSRNCGMAVRENGGVAFVEWCNGRRSGVRGTGVTLTTSGSKYIFRTAAGREVSLQSTSAWARAPGMDRFKSYGMCGNNNGDPNDDAPGYRILRISDLFPEQRTINPDLFNWYPTDADAVVTNPHREECDYVEEPWVPPIIDHGGQEDITDLLRDHDAASNTDTTQGSLIIDDGGLGGPTQAPLTIEDAFNLCDTRIRENPAVQACVEQLNMNITNNIIGCVQDFAEDGNQTEWVSDAVNEIINECAVRAAADNRLDDLANNLCPSVNEFPCSGFGQCVNRTCVCDAGRTGGDCNINLNQPPQLTAITDNLCDTIGIEFCQPHNIFVAGSNFQNTPQLSCFFGNLSVAAHYLSSSEVLCGMPQLQLTGFGELRVNVRVSNNNGSSVSNALPVIYYDSRCMVCNSTTTLCDANPASCIIDGVCYRNSLVNPDNGCQYCNTSLSTDSWSVDASKLACHPRFTQPTYPVRVVDGAQAGDIIAQVNASNALMAADPNNVITFTLQDSQGNTPSNYEIDQNGVITVLNPFNVTYEFQSQADNVLYVIATDSYGNTAHTSVVLEFLEGNSVPVFNQTLFEGTVAENSDTGTPVLQLFASDADGGNLTYSWFIQPEGFADALAINSQTGAVTVNSDRINFEATPLAEDGSRMLVFSAEARDDNGQTHVVGVHIQVTNVNEAPVEVQMSNLQVPENSPADVVVANLSTVDPDFDNTFSYNLVDTNVPFKIVGAQLLTNGNAMDYETQPNHMYTISVRSTDQGTLSTVSSFNVSLTNVNEPPYNVQMVGNASVPETVPVGSALNLTLSAQDPEGDVIDCGLLGVGDDNRFMIENNKLIVLKQLDYETWRNHTIQIVCSERTNDADTLSLSSDTVAFTITVLDMPEAPQIDESNPIALNPDFIHTTTTTVAGSASTTAGTGSGTTTAGTGSGTTTAGTGSGTTTAGTGSGTTTTTAGTGSGSTTTAGTGSGSTTTTAGTGSGTTTTAGTGSGTTTAGTGSGTTTAGTGSGSTTTTAATTTTARTTPAPVGPGVPENVPAGTVVGVISARDPDEDAGDFTFSLPTDMQDHFELQNPQCQPKASDGSVTCTVQVVTTSDDAFDFERPETHQVRVLVNDSSNNMEVLTVPVPVINENDPPSDPFWVVDPDQVDMNPGSIPENAGEGHFVGLLQGNDEDEDDSLTFKVNNPGDFFRLVPVANDRRRSLDNSRAVRVELGADAELDFEQNPTILLNVSVMDNGVPPQERFFTVTINVTDQAMLPMLNNVDATNPSHTWNLAENAEVVGTITIDGFDRADLDEQITLVDDAAGVFSVQKISRDNWQLRATPQDFEGTGPKNFNVSMQLTFVSNNPTVSNALPVIAAHTSTVKIVLTDVDEAPYFFSVPVHSVNSDSSLYSSVGAIVALDQDRDDVTYSISDNGARFGINTTTGVVHTLGSLDAVLGSSVHSTSYKFNVTAHSTNLQTRHEVTVLVHDDCYNVVCPSTEPGPCTDKTAHGTRFEYTCDPSTLAQNNNNNAASTGSSSSSGMLVGVVVGVLLAVALVVLFVLIIARRRSQKATAVNEAMYESVMGMENPSFNPSGPMGPINRAIECGVHNPLYKWYQPDMTRQDAEELLLDQEEGSFVVRDSAATPGWHMMAVKTKNSIKHEKIKLSDDGMYELLPSANRKQPKFSALPDLVEHYGTAQAGMEYALYLDNPLYDNSQLMERRTGRTTAAAWAYENDPSAPSVPLKEKERLLVEQVAGEDEDEDIYTNTMEAKSALGSHA